MGHSPRFNVVRQNWQRFPRGWRRLHGETVLASFATRAEAEADAARREREARAAVNPFACGIAWTDRTDMPEPVFADWVADADLPAPPLVTAQPAPRKKGRRDGGTRTGTEPPAQRGSRREPSAARATQLAGRRDWAAWWELVRADHPPRRRAPVWDVLSKLRFYSVRRREPGPRLFVLSRVAAWEEYEREDTPGGWREWWEGRMRLLGEGGDPIEVSFDRRRLGRRAAELYAQEDGNFPPNMRYDTRRQTEDPFTAQSGEPVYQPPRPEFRFRIDEIPLDEEPEQGKPVFLVDRAAYDLSDGGLWTLIETDVSCSVVPVRAFRRKHDAQAYRDVLNRATHEVMDPVLFPPGWSTGVCGAAPLIELAAGWGLPEVPTRPSVFREGERMAVLPDLAQWWEANGRDLTTERRVELWGRLGDYRYMNFLTQFTPDRPGGRVM